jgi:predicted nucleotidyltransferase
MDAGQEWIDRLPAELDRQRALLRGLLRGCDSDQEIRWLAIGCSLGRGAADRMSDLDLAMGVATEDFDAAAARVARLVAQLGDLVESYEHQIAGLTTTHVRIFAQYADRSQVDLVVFGAAEPIGSVRDLVVLYDPDAIVVTGAGEQRPATPRQVREWAFGAWCALADLGKYLRRGSAWEAFERLNEARGQLWRLQATALGVPNPQYGLTSILDFAADRVPAGMDRTVSDLDPGRLLAAARSLAEHLGETSGRLPPEQRAMLPAAMAGYITRDLADLALPSPAARGAGSVGGSDSGARGGPGRD